MLTATVRNTGTNTSAHGYLVWRKFIGEDGDGLASYDWFGRHRLSRIAAGGSRDFSTDVRMPLSAGNVTTLYSACVDADNLEGNRYLSCSDDIGVTIRPAIAPNGADPRFNDTFWQEMIFNQRDDPGTLSTMVSHVFGTTRSPNVYIVTDEMPDGYADIIARRVPFVFWQVTGRRYNGRIERGSDEPLRPGWINVTYSYGDRVCGLAWVGASPGWLWINQKCVEEAQEQRDLDSVTYLTNIFAHEFGHTLGLFHVSGLTDVMNEEGRTQHLKRFSAREQYHARLAYRIGPAAVYCGWPYRAACTDLNPPLSFQPRRIMIVD